MNPDTEFAEFIQQFRARAARRLTEFEREMEKTRARTTRALQPQPEITHSRRQVTGPVHSVLRKRRY